VHARWLLPAGAFAFLAFAVALTPARLLADLAGLGGIVVSNPTGTAWRGEASAVRGAGVALGRTRWTLHPAALLAGRVGADLDVMLADGFLRGYASVGMGGSLHLEEVEAASPLAAARRLLPVPVTGGQATARIESLAVEERWPRTAVGTVRVADVPLLLPGAPGADEATGSFEVRFDTVDAADDGELVGTLRDLGGALELSGEVRLYPPGDYEVSGRVRPRDDAPRALADSLNLLGPPGPDGTRPFSLAGSI